MPRRYATEEHREGLCGLCQRQFAEVEVIVIERREDVGTKARRNWYWCKKCWKSTGRKNYGDRTNAQSTQEQNYARSPAGVEAPLRLRRAK